MSISRLSLLTLVLASAPCVAAGSVVLYEEDFDPAPPSAKAFTTTIFANNSAYEFGNWLLSGNTTGGSFIVDRGGTNGNVLEPQIDGVGNGRYAMTVIDTNGWLPGEYTLEFDVLASPTDGGERLYIAAANGFGDKTDANGIAIDLVTNGLATGFGATGVGNATVVDLINVEIDGQTSARLTQTFTLTGPTEGVVLGFGGFGTGYGVDNITVSGIVPSPASFTSGLVLLGLGMLRRH